MEKLLLDYCRELNKSSVDQKKRADIYMDILLSLIMIIEEESSSLPISPGAVVLDDDNHAQLKNERVEGILYNAPETIFEGADNSASARLFSLGLVIFYMIYGKDFYSFIKMNLLDIEFIKKRFPNCLINIKGKTNGVFPEEIYQGLVEVMKDLTAWDPGKRESGKVKLIKMYSNIISDNRIFLVEGDSRIGTVHCKTREDRKRFPGMGETLTIEDTEIGTVRCVIKPEKNRYFRYFSVYGTLTINSSTYKLLEMIDIPYRPGEHTYTIRVSKTG